MAILIANIGTSDLLINVDGYYFPIGFDRDEKNINTKELSEEEKQLWDMRFEKIAMKLCPELEIKVKTIQNQKRQKIDYDLDFKQITKQLSNAYRNDSTTWKKRLIPGRISGVIENTQQAFKIHKIYIFITDQSTIDKPDFHRGDTCYLFKILKMWFGDNITLIPVKISEDVNKEDALLEFYYNFFHQNISIDETVLVSIKGGTPQMQTALKMQAIASSIPKLLFIDPQLDISKILKGESSECIITSYWRYLRTQKYQTIKLLLNKRWDFNGAKVILEEWQNTLMFLSQYLNESDSEQLNQERQKLKSIDIMLKKAADNFNFVSEDVSDYILHSLLNLYAQCRIYWELEEIANVLPRIASFYEESLQVIIRHLSKKQWFLHHNENEKWILLKEELLNSIEQEYYRVEKEFDRPIRWKKNEVNKKEFKLGNRYRKRNFAEALINSEGNEQQLNNWQNITNDLTKIDFWVDKRNDLIHGGKGLTLDTMEQELENYQKNYTEEDKNDSYKPDPARTCNYKNILGHITCICEQLIQLVEQEPNSCVGYSENTPYYLYSELRDRIIKRLDE